MKNLCILFLSVPLAAMLALPSCERKASSSAAEATKTTTQAEEAEWCAEHGVPESICTRCHPKLIADFKQKGDWCKDHNLPKSQCIQCDPGIKAKLEAMKPGA